MSIPNTLTIYLKTRIRGQAKIKYKTSITVPGVHSDTVYFSPIIKLSKNAINNIPRGYPESEVYTQFFDENAFQSLVNRSITNISQARVPINEATKKGIVDNNIELIINTLFKKNTNFYIQGKTYTIYSHDWIRGDWQVDKKKFDTYMLQRAYGPRGYGYMATQDKIAENELNELKKIDNGVAIKGFAVTSPDLTSKIKEEFESTTGMGLGKKVISAPTTAKGSTVTTTTMTPEQEAIIKEGKKQLLPKKMYKLVTNLTLQSVINYDDGANLSSDPVSLTILYSIDRNFSKDINANKELLEPLYNELIENGNKYKDAKDNYDKALGTYIINTTTSVLPTPVEISNGNPSPPAVTATATATATPPPNNLFKDKKNFDNAVEQLYAIIKNYKKTKKMSYTEFITNPKLQQQKSALLQIIVTLEKYKKQFLNKLLQSLGLLIKKNEMLINYINSLTKFYVQLYLVKEKTFKLNHVENETDNILTLNIIKFDIQCYKTLLYNFNTSTDKSKSLSISLQNVRQAYKQVETYITKMKTTQSNFRDIFKNYYDHRKLLKITRYQFDIYIFNVLQYDQEIELNIWKLLYKQTDNFLNNIKDTIIGKKSGNEIVEGKLDIARNILAQYNQRYTQQQRDAFLQNVMQTNKPLDKQSSAITDFVFPSNKMFKQQQNDYIRLQKIIMLCYDLITIYARISAIKYSREISLIGCKEDLNNIQIKIYKRTYESNVEVLKDSSMVPFIPEILLGQQQPYNDKQELKNDTADIRQKYESMVKLNKYKDILDLLKKKYYNAIELIIPHISKLGVLNECQQIVKNEDDIENERNKVVIDYDDKIPLTQGEKIVNFYQKEKKEYFDIKSTKSLQTQFLDCYYNGIKDTIIPETPHDEQVKNIMNWIVIDNYGGKNAPFSTIAFIFNNYLVNSKMKSNNPFSDDPPGYYSIESLKRAITDSNYGLHGNEYNLWQSTDVNNLEQIIRTALTASNLSLLGKQYVEYHKFLINDEGRWIGNDINAVRNAIMSSPDYIGSLDLREIRAIERIFKIKFIVIRVEVLTTDKPYIPVNTMVSFNSRTNNKLKGFISAVKRNSNNNSYTYNIIDENYVIHNNMSIRVNNIIVLDPIHYSIANTGYHSDEPEDNNDCFAFILENIMPTTGLSNWEYMYNFNDNKFIYSFHEIPDFLKYFVFEKEWKFLNDDERRSSWLNKNIVWRPYIIESTKKYDRKIREARGVAARQRGGQIQNPGQNMQSLSVQKLNHKSNLSYYVVVDLELYPGESIPLIKQPVIACHIRYEKIRQAFAEMFGLLYRPLEFNQSGHVSLSSTEYELKKRNEEAEKYKEDKSYPDYNSRYDDRHGDRYSDTYNDRYTRNYRRPYYGGNKNATRRIKYM